MEPGSSPVAFALALSRCQVAATSSSTAPFSIADSTSARVVIESISCIPMGSLVSGDRCLDESQRSMAAFS